jgi:peptide/nickel transport system substrate-binding protein
MEKFYSRISQSKIAGKLPKKDEINLVVKSFSKKERIIFILFVLTLIGSTLGLLESINKSMMVKVPFRGGYISEGIIGAPRFINPVLANSPVDMDMTALLYSGLMRKNADGTLSVDLADGYEVSQNALTYTFTLRDEIYFHDGKPVTADDVVFTINKAKDSVLKSPRKINWEGTTAVKINDKTIEFTLKQPNPAFLGNATLGIMPKHIWDNSPIELNSANTSPVGSGPYKIKSSAKEGSGIINSYELTAFDKFALGQPYIKKMDFHFYQNEEDMVNALEKKEVDQISSITPMSADILKEKNHLVNSSVLPRVFGLFFNQTQNILFTNKVVAEAIDRAIDKDRIINEVLYGYGVAISDPIPPNMVAYQKLSAEKSVSRQEILQDVASKLEKDGWTKNEEGFLQKVITDKNKKKTTTRLEFSISTSNAPELARTAELIKEDLENIGMKVDIKTFEVGNLNQSVIRPRSYDALLFGQIINNESDLFAFWHSSQRKDPGLNVAIYTNVKVDKILEDAFVTIDDEARIKKYAEFETEIKKDMPAVFLYSPHFIYVTSPRLKGLSFDHIITPSDRFYNVHSWYTETENVWKIFNN